MAIELTDIQRTKLSELPDVSAMISGEAGRWVITQEKVDEWVNDYDDTDGTYDDFRAYVFNSLGVDIDISSLKSNPSNQRYSLEYNGYIYMRKGRFYGLNIYASYSYWHLNYNYGGNGLDILPSIDYTKASGAFARCNGILKSVTINAVESIGTIDNMQILLNKITTNKEDNTIVNDFFYHEDTKEKGRLITGSQPIKDIEIKLDQPVKKGDIIAPYFGFSGLSNSTKRIYGANIKLNFE